MGKSQRNKGASAERELLKLLTDSLNIQGERLCRNFAQTYHGGADCLDPRLHPLALEVKRQESAALGGWWRQAVKQADRLGLIPVLAYRQNRMPWTFGISAHSLCGAKAIDDPSTVFYVSYSLFCEIAREYLAGARSVIHPYSAPRFTLMEIKVGTKQPFNPLESWAYAVANAPLTPVLRYKDGRSPWKVLVPYKLLGGLDRPLTREWCLEGGDGAFEVLKTYLGVLPKVG